MAGRDSAGGAARVSRGRDRLGVVGNVGATLAEGSSPNAGNGGYGQLLRLDELLELQERTSADHDELLFVVVHQAYELWFKLLLAELDAVRDLLLANEPRGARHLLARIHVIVRLMNEQLGLIDTMSFPDFLAFREGLGSASAIESWQFREVEFVSGLKDARYLGFGGGASSRLEQRLQEPSIWEAYCALLEQNGLPMPADDAERRLETLTMIFRAGGAYPDLFAVSEDLIGYDQAFRLWRCRHVLMVERQIGGRPGTGGTSGVDYLRRTLGKYFYPDLWQARTRL